jgi:hypothetical protein
MPPLSDSNKQLTERITGRRLLAGGLAGLGTLTAGGIYAYESNPSGRRSPACRWTCRDSTRAGRL